jgi:hypothetical protein
MTSICSNTRSSWEDFLMQSRSIILFVAFMTSGGGAGAADLADLLNTITAAYGGSDAVSRLESYRAEGSVHRAAGSSGVFIRDYRAPDRMKVEIGYPDRSELRVVIGNRAWRGSRSGIEPVEGPMRTAMWYQLLRSELPGVLMRNHDRLEDRGIVEHEGGSHRLLVLRWSEGIEMRYWVEDGSNRVTHVESTLSVGPGQAVFATAFADFREIDGVLFPFTEKNYASGRHVAETRIERLILDPEGLPPIDPPEDVGAAPDPNGSPTGL